MKSSKSEGPRNSQMNGAAAPREAGPLFPRLHVNETEKAGPRAPPRNKMALFEQFTVPSHRFVQPQPSRTSIALSNQPQQFEHRNPYFSHYTPSLVPYSNANPQPQPSHGVSSCVTSSVSESQRDSSSQTSEKYKLSRTTTIEDGSINLSYLLEEKAKVVSDDIPMQSSPRAHLKTRGLLFTSSDFENICDKYASSSEESPEMLITTATKKDLLEAMSNMGEVVACPVVESQGCGHDKAVLNKSMEGTDAIRTKRVTQKGVDAANEYTHGCSSLASEQSCQQPDVIHDTILPEDLSQLTDAAGAASYTDLKNNGCREDQSSSPCENCLVASAHTSMSQQLLGSVHVSHDACEICSSDIEKHDTSASADVLIKDKGENTGDSQNNQMGSDEVSGISQQGTGRDTDDSLLSVLTAQAIRPKDVIRAVGQQQFWRARKALLRQQRIFSDQVFQLHKLIKVQQLLAETPGTLSDEERPFGTVDHCFESPSQCNIEGTENRRDRKTHVTSSLQKQGPEDQSNKEGNEPESIQNPQWHAAVGNDGLGSNPCLPAFTPGGVSVWGYPSLGMGQWLGAQDRPFAYQPFAGSFTAEALFGGLYGPAGLGPVSPIVPLCIPYTGQRSGPWEETSPNHGPHVAAGPNSQVAPAFDHMAHDGPGAWQFVQYNHPYYNQRFYAGASEKNASSGSGAPNNHQRPVKPLHASGTERLLGEANRLNNNGPGNSIHQSENSSACDTSSLKLKSSAYMRSTPVPRKAGYHNHEAEQPVQMSTGSVFRAFSSSKQRAGNGAGMREEAHRAELRFQSDQVPSNNENVEETTGRLSDQSGNALDLFPLVPSLIDEGGQSSSKQTNSVWQGRVIKAVPHPAVAASQSTAGILLSLQRERRQ